MNNHLKSAFDQIHAEPELKQNTLDFLSEKVYRSEKDSSSETISGKKRRQPAAFVRIAAAAACLLLFLCGGGSYLYFTPTAYISIDINPSLELGVNRFDRIISVEGYNDDGTALAASLNIRFLDYQDAIEQLLEDETVESYLSGDAVMSLTVAGKSESQSSTILENVESCVSDRENVRCHSGDVTEMHDAHECGMSFGKYQVFLRLQELDPAITADDVRDLSMREILDLIEEYSTPSDSAGASDNAGDIPGSCSNDGSVETSGNSGRGHENGHGSHH